MRLDSLPPNKRSQTQGPLISRQEPLDYLLPQPNKEVIKIINISVADRHLFIDVSLKAFHNLGSALLRPDLCSRYLLSVIQGQSVGQMRKWIRFGLIVIGGVRSLLTAARAWTEGFDSKLIPHVLMVLLGGKVHQLRRRRTGNTLRLLAHDAAMQANATGSENRTRYDARTYFSKADMLTASAKPI